MAPQNTPRYTDLTDAISALRELPLTFARGASRGELFQLRELLVDTEADIAPVLALFEDHDGFSNSGWPEMDERFASSYGTRFTLMPIGEVIETRRSLQQEWPQEPEEAAIFENLLPLWTDSANFMCFYLSGPLAGRLGYLWHEVPFFIQPLFRDIPALLSDLVREARTGENAFDYPSNTPRPEWDDEDRALTEHFLRLYQSTENALLQQNAGNNAIYLCPPQHLKLLQPLRESARNLDTYDYRALLRRLEKRENGEEME
ncbi:MAG: hypothetical protein QM758_28365 [Armatimonas sp.]